jgi:hypothetical protein
MRKTALVFIFLFAVSSGIQAQGGFGRKGCRVDRPVAHALCPAPQSGNH